MYVILRGAQVVGRSRFESPELVTGAALGHFEPGPAFAAVRLRLGASDDAAAGGRSPGDDELEWLANLLGADGGDTAFADLRVAAPDGRLLNARITGIAGDDERGWHVGARIADANYWRRVANGEL